MSCILFTKASYAALAPKITTSAMHRDLLQHYYPTPEAFTTALWKLNVQAFNDRYEGRYAEDVETARETNEVDDEFQKFIKADRYGCEPLALVALHRLLGRISYQVSDANNYRELPLYWHLEWCQHWVADKMAALITQRFAATENYSKPSSNAVPPGKLF